ncbi:Ig-like domain-containing protein [Pseudomonas sp. LS-2]|uniref:Ig-like domain-containing protein n=1 Tax=Pseudomonas sp. LS-2 TaxID=2315859 RepID=UPI000E7429A8|nr:Ig-like domain-containing protein [Pseudomonas sp. LS-2]RJX82285.1 tandem-95 repeat protein [Pseudomonas sp. LS-2]
MRNFLILTVALLQLFISTAWADGGSVIRPIDATFACPAGQTGSIVMRCTFNLNTNVECKINPDGTPKVPSQWTVRSNSCVAAGPTFVATQSETQALTCPATTPGGSIYQARTYDLYSDGSRQNYSGWTVYNSCYAVYQSTQTENQQLTCPAATPAGTNYQSRTYEVWTDGSIRNYSAWVQHPSCSAIYQSTQTETQALACPTNTPSGTNFQTRTYDLWTDGSKKNYSSWTQHNSCYNVTPTAINASLTTDEDTKGSVTLTLSDDGPGPYTFEIVTASPYGTATLSGSTLSFMPSQDWNGTTTLTYRVMDGAGAWSAPATVTITVRPVNDPPVAQAKTLTIDEDTVGTVTLTATDIDSPTPTVFQIVTPPANATATIAGSTLTFTPDLNWNGTTTLTYRAQDTAGAWSEPALITVVVIPVNDAPVLTSTVLTIRTKESTPKTVRAAVAH